MWGLHSDGASAHLALQSAGVQAVETVGKGGPPQGYLSLAQEQEVLAPFFGRAHKGEGATVAELQRAFEARIGHEVDDSTIYPLLHPDGWRKRMPRPRHPQANREAQEQLKKTLLPKSKRSWPRAGQRTSDPC